METRDGKHNVRPGTQWLRRQVELNRNGGEVGLDTRIVTEVDGNCDYRYRNYPWIQYLIVSSREGMPTYRSTNPGVFKSDARRRRMIERVAQAKKE